MDSALILALTHDKLDIKSVHHTSLVYDDELKTSRSVSKYFNKQLDIIYEYKNKNTTLLKKDDISEYLHTAYNYISQKDTVVFFLANHHGIMKKISKLQLYKWRWFSNVAHIRSFYGLS